MNLTGASITGASYVGSLAGYNAGKITNAKVLSGSVTSTASTFAIAGGLVGSNAGTIQGGEATVEVTGKGRQVGGLVGRNDSTGKITASRASGINVKGYTGVGGLVGYNAGSIADSIGTVTTVTGVTNVGGLVGYNYFGGTINGTRIRRRASGRPAPRAS